VKSLIERLKKHARISDQKGGPHVNLLLEAAEALSLAETIKWIPVTESLPDDDMSVLTFMPGQDHTVWPGYMCGDRWRTSEGLTAVPQPKYWANMPEGPQCP
jgi:hypothetical protein